MEDPEFKDIYKEPIEPYEINNELLYKDKKLCVPAGNFRENLLYDNHNAPVTGHLGYYKTLNRLQSTYYWRDLVKNLRSYCRSCRDCQESKSSTQKPLGLLKPLEPPSGKWESITMDFIGPLTKTKKCHSSLLVFVDRLTKMIRLCPTNNRLSAKGTAKLFHQHVYRNHGLPAQIISDRDPLFTSAFWKFLFKMLGVKLSLSSSFHPETDGQSERSNRKVEEMIRSFTNDYQDNWDEHLIDFEVAYNSALNSTTTFSPFYLNYGIEPRIIPVDTVFKSNSKPATEFLENIKIASAKAQEQIKKRNEYMAEYANRKRSPHQLKVGDLAFLSTKNLKFEGNKKLNPKFVGPYKITEAINDVTFRLDLPDSMKARKIYNAFHASLLRPCIDEYQPST